MLDLEDVYSESRLYATTNLREHCELVTISYDLYPAATTFTLKIYYLVYAIWSRKSLYLTTMVDVEAGFDQGGGDSGRGRDVLQVNCVYCCVCDDDRPV